MGLELAAYVKGLVSLRVVAAHQLSMDVFSGLAAALIGVNIAQRLAPHIF